MCGGVLYARKTGDFFSLNCEPTEMCERTNADYYDDDVAIATNAAAAAAAAVAIAGDDNNDDNLKI